MASKQCRRWCFTLNNYTDEDIEKLNNLGEEATTNYMIYGKERGEGDTPHIQGYIVYSRSQRFNRVKRDINVRCHLEEAKPSTTQNITYCKKGGDFKEFGEAKERGERTDIHVKSAIKRRREGEDWETIIAVEGSGVLSRRKAIEEVVAETKKKQAIQRRKKQYENVIWKPWQQEIINIINEEPDDRTIHWYYEEKGNVGKSYLASYIATEGGFVAESCKTTDVAFAYNYEKVFVLDLIRSMEENIPYGLMESMKNGRIFSGKYNSTVKIFEIPHVFVFANFPPDTTKLSKDRWHIVNIKNDG